MSAFWTLRREPARTGCFCTIFLLCSFLAVGDSAFAADDAAAITPMVAAPVTSVTTPRVEDKWHAAWLASIAIHGAATAFDAYSSYHRGPYEANSLLADSNGQFGNKAVAMKAGIFGASTLVQFTLIRWANRHDTHLARTLTKTFTIVNVSAGGTYMAAGMHNFGVVSTATGH